MHSCGVRFLVSRGVARFLVLGLLALGSGLAAATQINSGSDGHDGAFSPAVDTVIDMADHPDGIYHYTSVRIPGGVTVSFIPNGNNTPVIWLVQGECVIHGTVDVSAHGVIPGQVGTLGGPGGYRGGSAGSPGHGIGRGAAFELPSRYGQNASYGSKGSEPSGQTYGNMFVVPLLGGSGGGGADGPTYSQAGGFGGGGAILISASASIEVSGSISANGGGGRWVPGGNGSGGAIRLVSHMVTGSGELSATGGWNDNTGSAGLGRIRIDAFENSFGGHVSGAFSQGFQPIIIPAPGQGIQLAIASVGGASVPENPSGVLANPDVIISGQQANPIPIVVHCSNIPLNTEITVEVRPANGPVVQAIGLNNTGTQASSTATIPVNMPRGGGIILAKAVTGINSESFASAGGSAKGLSLAQTGLTTDGETLSSVEVTATLGGRQKLVYLTKSGKRYTMPAPSGDKAPPEAK